MMTNDKLKIDLKNNPDVAGLKGLKDRLSTRIDVKVFDTYQKYLSGDITKEQFNLFLDFRNTDNPQWVTGQGIRQHVIDIIQLTDTHRLYKLI